MYVYSAYDRKSKYPGEAVTASVAGCWSVAAEARLRNRGTVSEIVLRTVVHDVILRVGKHNITQSGRANAAHEREMTRRLTPRIPRTVTDTSEHIRFHFLVLFHFFVVGFVR